MPEAERIPLDFILCSRDTSAVRLRVSILFPERAKGARLFERATGPILRQDSELFEFIQSLPELIVIQAAILLPPVSVAKLRNG